MWSQRVGHNLATEQQLCMKLNKWDDNIWPWQTPFSILNQSILPCLVLTVASWPAHRFLRRQVRWSGIPICLRIVRFVLIHTVKGFSRVNKAEVDVFLEFLCFSYDPVNGLVVFPTFFSLSLNFAIMSSWSEPQSAPDLVLELLHLWLQRT